MIAARESMVVDLVRGIIANHRGRAQAISIAQIARVAELSPREIKQAVHDLRLAGVRIGSARYDAGQAVAGYFMISTDVELHDFLRSYRRQAMSELAVIRAMIARPLPALASLAEQLDLHLGKDL